MKAQIKLGRIFGVEIGLHYSWFLIALLITLSIAGQFQVYNPSWSDSLRWGLAIVTAFLFFAAIVAHELSHAVVAKARGLPVRSITLFALGGVAQIEKEAADARTRQAEAEKLLAQVKKKQDPRVIRADMFKNARFSSEPYRVDVLYPKASDESFIVAGQLARALSEIPGWSISAPKPVPESTEQELSPLLAAGGQPLGITIRTSNLDGVAKALMRTLNQDDFETVRVRDPSLAANELKIIVGPRL